MRSRRSLERTDSGSVSRGPMIPESWASVPITQF